MQREGFVSLLLCLTLCGCGTVRSHGQISSGDAPAEPVPQKDVSSVLQEAPLDTATYLPESLIEELRFRMLNGSDTYEVFQSLEIGRSLSEEEAAVLAPDLFSDDSTDDTVYSTYHAVDFDNDGIEDLFVCRRMGMGSMGMFSYDFYQGLSDGTYVQTDSMETYMVSPLFISWDASSYLLCLQWDQCSKNGIWQESYIGLSVTAFADGRAQETAWLTFDPTVLWTEAIYDETGIQTGWAEGAPEDRNITLSVYTREINTDFPLSSH